MDWKKWGMSILSGLLLVVCFPRPDWEGAAWCALVPLLFVVEGSTPRAAFGYGFLSGVVRFAGVLYWLVQTMALYGNLPVSISTLIYLLLVITCGLFDAVFAMGVARLRKEGMNMVLFTPCLWVSLEWIRSVFMTGFPWASLGYSQYLFHPLIQIADITGMYGVSFLVVMGNAVIAEVLISKWGTEPRRLPVLEISVTLILLAVSLGYGFWRIQAVEEKMSMCTTPLQVGLIQGNIRQDEKWTGEYQQKTIDIYQELSRQAASGGAEIIVWPETAAPFFFELERDKKYADQIRDLAGELELPFCFGSLAYEVAEHGRFDFLNRAYLLSPEGSLLGKYDKIHLVPFGEYVPYQFVFGFVHKMVQAAGNFYPGENFSLLTFPRNGEEVKIGSLICYELIFPDLSRKFIKKGANLLVTITNDAWFGRTSAPYQHFSMGVFRSIENRVWLVRAANTGISGVIDPLGRIRSTTEIFTRKFLVESVCPGSFKTFYTFYGDVFLWGCVGISLLGIGAVVRKWISERKSKKVKSEK